MPADRASRKPVVKRGRSVPRAHARELNRVEKSLTDRATNLSLANAYAQIDARRGAIATLLPDSRIVAPTIRRRGSRVLSRRAAADLVAAGGRSSSLVSRELTKDVRRLRRLLVDTVRRGQNRPVTVGDPTTFLCNLTASSMSTTRDAFSSTGAFTSLTPIASTTGVGMNRSRFLGTAFAPVNAFSFGLLQISQFARFTFSTGIASTVTLTVHMAPVGSYRIDAPSKQFMFPSGDVVPTPSLRLTAAASTIATWPVPLPGGSTTRLTTTMTSAVSLVDRRLNGAGGMMSETGLLQGIAAPATITLPAFAIGAGATVTVSVLYFLEVFAQSGGLVLVDCLTNPSAGINVPGVILRMDY